MKRYKLTSPKMRGEIVLTYWNGNLTEVELVLIEPLTAQQFNHFIEHLPYLESVLLSSGAGALKVEEINEMASNDKIAMFCRYFFDNMKVKYKVSAADAGKIKNVEVTDKLMEVYFKKTQWWSKTKSISNYVKHFNELRTLAAGTYPDKTVKRWPDEWTASFENSITDMRELNEWYKHLYSLGLRPVYRGTQCIKWENKTVFKNQ